ncbi:hypothetical protein L9W80_18765 [Vibrio aestuarianus]|uniref:hypothetical protein n=1 Tax=Vibrio aestuarianus TaxID=28171 RepID=UPI00237C6B77|nr:hypothetical protein [Vibrio aestuarianus]MDE1352181.1 hypothetical protein [Vibrio aestuarianus]
MLGTPTLKDIESLSILLGLPAIPYLFTDVTFFAKTHRVGRDKVLRLMDLGRIPEVDNGDGGKRYIDMQELSIRMRMKQFSLSELYEEDEA